MPPPSFDDMLCQFRSLSTSSCLYADTFSPRHSHSQSPSPLLPLSAPLVPVSCHPSDLCIPPSHAFHIDTLSNFSPVSSSSGSSDGSCGLDELSPSRSLFEHFRYTRSRVLRFQKDHRTSTSSLVSFLAEHLGRPPMSIWALNDRVNELNHVWAIFESHEEACSALPLSHPSISIAPALESDLERLSTLHRVDPIETPAISYPLRMSFSTPDLHKSMRTASPAFAQADFIISSNPPNPRTTFRLGDWICNSANCAAHNFGRNLACRGCGCPRSDNQPSTMQRQGSCGPTVSRLPASPRFVNPSPHPPISQSSLSPPTTSPLYTSVGHHVRGPATQSNVMGAKPSSPSHPLLTPSGRSFAVGGKVQNISSDPMAPCIMYWPDNEPVPDQGQIRPSNLMVVPQPPILNTGNRGPIEHQPGDWICQKCNYLNWRRRKVCQTCFPYAEGNGDSISAAVQAERINLLTSLLAQNQLPLPSGSVSLASQAPRSHSMTPPQRRHTFMDGVPQTQVPCRSRSHSNFNLSTQYSDAQFIYETAAPRRASPPSFASSEGRHPASVPVPLLPSFLQDIVESPTLSPSSTSSADLSPEDYDDGFSSGHSSFGKERIVTNDSSLSLPVSNIWKLNDEETKGIAGVALPNIDLIGGRKDSREGLRNRSDSP